MKANPQMRQALAAGCIAAAIGLISPASGAQAQDKATVGASQSVTAKVSVVSIDRPGRTVVVKRDTGETISLKVPPEARNFDSLKPGDTIAATYTLETEYVLSARNAPLPADTVSQFEARTPKGERPGGIAGNLVVVTGTVLAVDVPNHTLKLVSPQGGAVHTVAVKTEEGRRAMPEIKVGDTITAYVSESVLLTVEPL